MCRLIRILALLCSVTSVVAEPLRIVADEWPPYVDPTAPGRGLAIELVTTAFSRAGYPTQLTVEDWSRSLEGAVIGENSIVGGHAFAAIGFGHRGNQVIARLGRLLGLAQGKPRGPASDLQLRRMTKAVR